MNMVSEAQQVGGEDPGDLAGALFGGEMFGGKDVRTHGVSGVGDAHSGLRVATGALSGGIRETMLL
jgi:hypothetical protein